MYIVNKMGSKQMKNSITTLLMMILTITISTALTFERDFSRECLVKDKFSSLGNEVNSKLNYISYKNPKFLQRRFVDNIKGHIGENNLKTFKDSTKNRISKTEEIRLNTNDPCSKIEREIDDFTDEVSLNTPRVVNRGSSSIILYKIVKNSKVVYYMGLSAYGLTVNIGISGVIILFEDGTKMNKPSEEIDVDTSDSGFEYSAFITLTEAEVQMLSAKKIKKYRLYIYDGEVNSEDANQFAEYVKCIIDKM